MAADVSSVEVSGRTFILTDRPSALFKNGRRNTNKPTFLDLTTSEAAGDLVIGRFALLWQYRRHFAPEDQCNAGVKTKNAFLSSELIQQRNSSARVFLWILC